VAKANAKQGQHLAAPWKLSDATVRQRCGQQSDHGTMYF